MRVRYVIGGIELQEHVIDELAEIYPEGRFDRWRFSCDLPEEDPRVRLIADRLHAHGQRPWIDPFRSREPNEYWLSLIREYDSKELAECDYLELRAAVYLFKQNRRGAPVSDHGGAYRDATGHIQLEQAFLRRRIDFASTLISGTWIVVPNRVKRLLEGSGLFHVAFRPTILLVRHQRQKLQVEWDDEEEPWWELTSDLVLPPVSGSMDLRDREGKSIEPGDVSNGCYRREGFYTPAELHYRKEDVGRVAPFDLGHTFESFGKVHRPEDRALVASKRFYEFCLEQKWTCDWVPVRLD